MDSGGAMYTLNSTEVHAVCYAIDHVVTGGATVRRKESVGMKRFPPRLKAVESMPSAMALTSTTNV